MYYTETRPSPALAEFIKCFWALEYCAANANSEPEPVLPDGCPEIVFNLSDRFLRLHPGHEEFQPTAILAGQMTRSILIKPSGEVNLFGVRFQPMGTFPILDFPVADITNDIVELGDATGATGRRIESQINAARTFGERVAIFESYFMVQLSGVVAADDLARRAIQLIVDRQGRGSVGDVAESLGISSRSLERRFKQAIGISPKMFARITRFQSVVRSVQSSSVDTMLDTALAFGYYDQSHLIRDFVEFAGRSPMDFLNRDHVISDVFTGSD